MIPAHEMSEVADNSTRTRQLRRSVAILFLAAGLCAAIARSGRELGDAPGIRLQQGSDEDFVRVTVPPNAHAGDMLQVQVPGRRAREVQVPAGAQPGQVLSFAISNQASPTSVPLSDPAPLASRSAKAARAIRSTAASTSPAPAPHTVPTKKTSRSVLQGATELGKFKGEFWKIPESAVENLDKIPDLVTLGEPDSTHPADTIDFDSGAFEGMGLSTKFAAHWTGEIQIKNGGTYTFYDRSDDGSKVSINDVLVVDNDGLHGAEEEKSGTIDLEAGRYPVAVDFFEKDGGANLHLKYSGPDTDGEATILRPAAAPPAPKDGDDFGPLIGAIKKVMAASSSKDPNAEAEAQKALKNSVESIVAIKIEQAKEKDDEARKAEEEREEKEAAKAEREEKEAAKAKETKVLEAKEEADEEKADEAAKEAAVENEDAEQEKDDEVAAAAAVEQEDEAAEGQLAKDKAEAQSAAEQAKSDEEKAKELTGQEEKVAEDVHDSEEETKTAQEAASSEAAAEAEEERSANEDAAAEKAAQDMADKAADKAVDAKDEAKQTAAEEAEAAKKNLAEAEQHAAANLAKENDIIDAAREAYNKAEAEAKAAGVSEDAAQRDVKEMQQEEDRAISQVGKAADGAESERKSAENERFDAEDAAKRSSVAEAKAADERDEARMERERAEKAAQDAYNAGIGNSAAESRIEEQIEAYRRSEEESMEDYKDSEERTIESNEKELKAAIERAQDQIRRAQAKIASQNRQTKDSTRDEVRKVTEMVKELKSEMDHAKAKPTSPTQYPYGVPYGTIWPYAGIYGGGWRRGREYSSRRWEDKAIFLQRELNDLQAERGLYERQLAVTAANIGLIKSGNAPSGASISAHPASTFAWFKGARPVASPPVPAVPFAGTAVPVMPAMPLAVAAATGTPTFPQAYSVARSTPSLMSVEEPLPTSEATAGLSSLAAGAPAQGAPAHLPRLQLMSVLARQEAAELAARGVDAAAQAQHQQDVGQQLTEVREAERLHAAHNVRMPTRSAQASPTGEDTQVIQLTPGSTAYTMRV